MEMIPDELICKKLFIRGAILLSNIFDDINHAKFFCIIGENPDEIIGHFFINSNINPILLGKQAILDVQYPIYKEDYPFLKYQSYLDCHTLQKVKKKVLLDSYKNNKTFLKGVLTTEHLNDILGMVRASDLFTPREKREFFS